MFGLNFNSEEYTQRCLAYYKNIDNMLKFAKNSTSKVGVNPYLAFLPEELFGIDNIIQEIIPFQINLMMTTMIFIYRSLMMKLIWDLGCLYKLIGGRKIMVKDTVL